MWVVTAEDLKKSVKRHNGILYINGCKNVKLPALPEGIIELDCTYNTMLVELPSLPTGLERLICSRSPKLKSLPDLPPSLKLLECHTTGITQLPTLPETLEQLYCSYVQLISISELPKGLKILSIGPTVPVPHPMSDDYYYTTYEDITKDLLPIAPASLPDLPVGLERLVCSGINLIEILSLPPNLKLLDCDYNPLTKLPTLPRALQTLDCSCTNIKELPPLPPGLSGLWIRQTLLTELPEIPDTLKITQVGTFGCPNLPVKYIKGEDYDSLWRKHQCDQSKIRAQTRNQAIKEELISIQSSRELCPFDNHLTI